MGDRLADEVGPRALVRPVLREVGVFGATLVGAVVLVQCLFALAPGDAIDLLPNAEEVREQLAREWGLDLPLPLRIAHALGRALVLDLGTSLTYRPGTPVLELLVQGVGASASILVPGWLGGLLLATALAWWTSAGRPGARLAQLVSIVPAFLAAWGLVTGLNALVWHGMSVGWWSRPAFFALPDSESPVRTALAITVLAIASGNLAHQHAALEAELGALRAAPFIEALRARGADPRPALLHNLLPPLLSVASARAAALLGTVVVVEKLLLLNGAGSMLWQACARRDFPVATGITLAAAALVALVRLVAELGRLAIDPRARSAA